MQMRWRTWSVLGLVLGALGLGLPAHAQVDDAVIEVVVQDETGGALPGVAVEATRTSTGTLRTETTGGAGTARLAALQPGSYDVKLTLSGFAPVVQEKVVVRVGQTARLSVKMKAAVTEQITVTADLTPLVDVHKTDSSTNIVPEQIEALPVADRDFQRLAFLTPGVQRERGGFRFVTGGPVIGAGGNASQSTILVDGADYTDPSLGLARVRFSQDAVQEFRVVTNRFDSQVGGSAGGALSIITKSGTNTLSGSAFGFYRADGLRSQGAYETSKIDYSRKQYGFTLGGPIQKDKTHFFVSLEQIAEDNIALFRPGGAFASLADDVAHPFDQTLALASLDHTINQAQRLSVRFAYERYREENFRVGGTSDVSYGQDLNRDNWNATAQHVYAPGGRFLNTVHVQVGKRKYEEPTNSTAVAEWFSSGNTLRTGTNIVGNLLGEATIWQVSDTLNIHFQTGKATHDVKVGASLLHYKDRFDFPVYENGLLIYVTDTKALPLAYGYGVGSGDATITPNVISGFVQDDIRPTTNLTLNVGVRYDLDTAGNNPDFTHPLRPEARGKDTNNIQPRIGFTYDIGGKGENVVRGGAGIFTGRFLLVPAFTELQQNGVTGRIQYTRLNGALLGVPALALNPANPQNTGIRLPPNITLLDTTFEVPYSQQATLGFTRKLGATGLYFDLEGIYVKGKDEIIVKDANFGGNANPRRPNPAYTNIATYTNEGRSTYKAAVASINGTVKGGHLVTASFTLASKKNVNDDFSPEFPFGYPNDPTDIDAEYGRSRADERFRMVLSGVVKLPYTFTLAPIYEYGSGQPWTQRLGYDFNGDGYNSDRPAGVGRNTEKGPRFSQLSVRLMKKVKLGERAGVDLIAECFNLLDTKNDSVASLVDSGNGAMFLSGPTLANPNAARVTNPNYGKYTATLSPREVQLGLRLTF